MKVQKVFLNVCLYPSHAQEKIVQLELGGNHNNIIVKTVAVVTDFDIY